jgi:hypothetical protein
MMAMDILKEISSNDFRHGVLEHAPFSAMSSP